MFWLGMLVGAFLGIVMICLIMMSRDKEPP